MRNHYLLLCLIAAYRETADAFLNPAGASSKTSLAAYYFGMENNDPPLEEDKPASTTMDRLNHQRASLARVVAAFPPTGHALALNHIEDVMVLDVDNQHMNIQATICEEESCAAVAVPVSFPHPCESLELEECVLENLQELDHEAELLLQHAEWEAMNQEYQDQGRNPLLDSGVSMVFPAWWMALPTAEMRTEGETLQNLLNEAEFATELRTMAQWGLGQSVQEAVVCAIGPTGMILRARLPTEALVEVPISFPIPADTGDQLRNQVLDALDSVGAQ